jgi:hypothetical protein
MPGLTTLALVLTWRNYTSKVLINRFFLPIEVAHTSSGCPRSFLANTAISSSVNVSIELLMMLTDLDFELEEKESCFPAHVFQHMCKVKVSDCVSSAFHS